MSKRKRIQRKRRKSDAERNEELLPKHAKEVERRRLAAGKPTKVILSPKGMDSLSDAISEILSPFVLPDASPDDYGRLVVVAIMAWNAVIVPPDKRQASLQEALNLVVTDTSKENRKHFEEFLEELMERRHQLFPHNKRWIVDYVVTDLGDTFHLSIMSGLPDNPTFEQKTHSLLPESVLSQMSLWQKLRARWRRLRTITTA